MSWVGILPFFPNKTILTCAYVHMLNLQITCHEVLFTKLACVHSSLDMFICVPYTMDMFISVPRDNWDKNLVSVISGQPGFILFLQVLERSK